MNPYDSHALKSANKETIAVIGAGVVGLCTALEAQRKGYYEALHASNMSLEVTDWLLWFAKTAMDAQSYSIAMIDHLIAKTKMMDRLRGQLNPRQEKALIRMFEAGPDGFLGGLSAKNYMTITDATTPTATRDLGDRDAMGALTPTGERKANPNWLHVL